MIHEAISTVRRNVCCKGLANFASLEKDSSYLNSIFGKVRALEKSIEWLLPSCGASSGQCCIEGPPQRFVGFESHSLGICDWTKTGTKWTRHLVPSGLSCTNMWELWHLTKGGMEAAVKRKGLFCQTDKGKKRSRRYRRRSITSFSQPTLINGLIISGPAFSKTKGTIWARESQRTIGHICGWRGYREREVV